MAERKRGRAEIGIEEWWDENAFGQKRKEWGDAWYVKSVVVEDEKMESAGQQ